MAAFKTPTRIQVESIECGAVAFWIILGYYNRWISIEEARDSVNCSRDGTNAQDIVNALEKYNIGSNGYDYSIDQLERPSCGFPVICWIHRSHWVVVESFKDNSFYISDPARGHRIASKKDFTDQYSGLTLSAKPANTFKPGGRRPIPLFEVIDLLSQFRESIILYFVLGVLATIPIVSLSSFVGYFTDTLITESQLNSAYVWFLVLIVGMGWLFSYLQSIIMRRLHLDLLSKLIHNTFVKIISLPVSFFPLRDIGELSQRVALPVQLSNLMTGPLANAVVGLATMFIYAGIMMSYNIYLGLFVVFLSFTIFRAMIVVADPLSKLAQKNSMATGKMTSNVLFMINNFIFMKLNGLESTLYQQWADNFAFSQDASQQSSYIQKRNTAFTSFLNQMSDYLIVITCGIFVLSGKLSTGQLLSFRLIALAFLAPVAQLSGVNSQFNNIVGDLNRLKDVWDSANASDVVEGFNEILNSRALHNLDCDLIKKINSGIDLDKEFLTIKKIKVYAPGTQNVLIDSIDCEIKFGDLISISGKPSSGKSVLLQTLAGILPTISGEIILYGQPLNQLNDHTLSSIITYVPQNPHFFNSSIYDNISLYNEKITKTRINKIMSIYDLGDICSSLPKGLDTVCLPSLTLSKKDQLVVQLLRALVRKPYILLLDDVFSDVSLDISYTLLSKITENVKTIIIATNQLELVSLFPRNVIIKEQKLADLATLS
jgi:ATP-binding cassette subfamily C protein